MIVDIVLVLLVTAAEAGRNEERERKEKEVRLELSFWRRISIKALIVVMVMTRKLGCPHEVDCSSSDDLNIQILYFSYS